MGFKDFLRREKKSGDFAEERPDIDEKTNLKRSRYQPVEKRERSLPSKIVHRVLDNSDRVRKSKAGNFLELNCENPRTQSGHLNVNLDSAISGTLRIKNGSSAVDRALSGYDKRRGHSVHPALNIGSLDIGGSGKARKKRSLAW